MPLSPQVEAHQLKYPVEDRELFDRASLQKRWGRGKATISKDLKLRRIPPPLYIGVKPYFRRCDVVAFEEGTFDLEAAWAAFDERQADTPPKAA